MLELISRIPRSDQKVKEEDEEPSTARKVLYSYLALILLQAELSAVIHRMNSINRERDNILRTLRITYKFKNRSPSFLVSATKIHPKRFLANCDANRLNPMTSGLDGIASVR